MIPINGKRLATAAEIKGEIKAFYHGLIGSVADSLEGIDVTVVRQGNHLSASSAQSLVLPVTNAEIDMALKGIHINKAPG